MIGARFYSSIESLQINIDSLESQLSRVCTCIVSNKSVVSLLLCHIRSWRMEGYSD